MMKPIFFSFLLLLVVISVSSGSYAEEIKIDDATLKEMILKVIKENPKVIFEAYHQYQTELRYENEKAQIEESFKNRIEDAINPDSPAKGNQNSPVTIIEYSDFECQYCAKASETIHLLMNKYPNQIKLVFKNNPLDFHKSALAASKAALGAGKQGKFWEFHDILFQNSTQLTEELFLTTAKTLGLNIDQFNADRASDAVDKQIQSEKEQAKKLNLTGTPSFIINGVIVRGAQRIEYFDYVIQRVMAESQKKK